MRRLKILKVFFIFNLFIFFIIFSNFELVKVFFLSTLAFNIPILGILGVGMIIVYNAAFKLTMLAGTFGILAYKKGDQLIQYLKGIDNIMPANIAHMFFKRAKGGTLYFTESESRDVTAWLGETFANQKSYIGFFVSTALMVGLLGTFSGLLKSIDDMGSIILSLGGDVNLAEVVAGFSGPLGGMAVGFGSSLFGVATAIILSVQTYILSRNQNAFIEDIEDWMKGRIIDTQSSDVIQQFQQAVGAGVQHVGAGVQHAQPVAVQGGGEMGISGSRYMDILAEALGEFRDSFKKTAESNEVIYKMLSQNIDATNRSTENEIALLERIVNTIKELNINQFSSSNTLDESIQGLSNIATNQNKTMKQLLDQQKQNQETMENLIQKLETRISNIEAKIGK